MAAPKRMRALLLASLTGCVLADLQTRIYMRHPEPARASETPTARPVPFGLKHPGKVQLAQLSDAHEFVSEEDAISAYDIVSPLHTGKDACVASEGRSLGTELPPAPVESEEEETCAGAVEVAQRSAAAALGSAVMWPRRQMPT
jgi:hypothetical protein